jgi:mRNA-degrading endonuclease RelE of RelBE toxin-antitoxin system
MRYRECGGTAPTQGFHPCTPHFTNKKSAVTAMKFAQPTPNRRSHSLKAREVRYERSFLLDLKHLEPAIRQRLQKFVFEEFYHLNQLQDLPEFHQIRSSEIFYRFSLDHYLLSLEVTGQIIKFLRVLPKPDV